MPEIPMDELRARLDQYATFDATGVDSSGQLLPGYVVAQHLLENLDTLEATWERLNG